MEIRAEARRECGASAEGSGRRRMWMCALNTTPCEGGHGTHPHTHTPTHPHTHTHRKPNTRHPPPVRARTYPCRIAAAGLACTAIPSTTSRARVRLSAHGVVWRALPPSPCPSNQAPNTHTPTHTARARARTTDSAFMRGTVPRSNTPRTLGASRSSCVTGKSISWSVCRMSSWLSVGNEYCGLPPLLMVVGGRAVMLFWRVSSSEQKTVGQKNRFRESYFQNSSGEKHL